MTTKIGPDSARRAGALRFGFALREAMRAKKVGQVRLAAAVGTSSTLINNYRLGHNVPTVEVAQRLAEALDAPALSKLARDARALRCVVCDAVFHAERGSAHRRYCGEECRRVKQKLRMGVPTRVRAAVAERSLDVYRGAVAAYCAGCEPEGLCRDGGCALRPVSPLPYADGTRTVLPFRPSNRNGPEWRVAVLAANERRWTPEARARHSAEHAARHAAMTPERRDAWRKRISEGRRAAGATRGNE